MRIIVKASKAGQAAISKGGNAVYAEQWMVWLKDTTPEQDALVASIGIEPGKFVMLNELVLGDFIPARFTHMPLVRPLYYDECPTMDEIWGNWQSWRNNCRRWSTIRLLRSEVDDMTGRAKGYLTCEECGNVYSLVHFRILNGKRQSRCVHCIHNWTVSIQCKGTKSGDWTYPKTDKSILDK